MGVNKKQQSYITKQRELELDTDIEKVKLYLKLARTLEATLAFRGLQEKLEHERRVIRKEK